MALLLFSQAYIYLYFMCCALGTHATIDLGGRMRLGPDTEYIKSNSDYTVDPKRVASFGAAVTRFLPNIDLTKLAADYAGIRPKLSAAGEPARDFVIAEESARGFKGLVNLVGIESPGLTSSLAIADTVAAQLRYPSCDWLAV